MEACVNLAYMLSNIREFDRARKYFQHALKIDSEHIRANYGLGITLFESKDKRADSIRYFQRVVTLEPNHYQSLTKLAIIYLDMGDMERAADNLKKAITLNDGYELALITMGRLLVEIEHPEKALRYYRNALRIDENNTEAMIGLG